MTTRTDYLTLIFAAWLRASPAMARAPTLRRNGAAVVEHLGGLEPNRRVSPRGLGRALDYS